MIAFGEIPVITTCPHCSVLVNGSCLPCAPGDTHPSCYRCEGGVYVPEPTPWYRQELVWLMLTSVMAAVATSIAVPPIVRAITGRKVAG